MSNKLLNKKLENKQIIAEPVVLMEDQQARYFYNKLKNAGINLSHIEKFPWMRNLFWYLI